jgi:methanogenic corrinoid protein MtbC1
MSKEEIYQALADSVVNLKIKDAAPLAQQALDEGLDPVEAINEGLVKGMSIVGDKFAEHKMFLPQVLVASKVLYAGLDILIPAIPAGALDNARRAGTAVMEGDVHDIGKNIVKTMLTAGGFLVTDMGKDIAPSLIVDKVKEEKLEILCLSTLMTPTMDGMKSTMDLMKESGLKEGCIVTIGGPPTSPQFAEAIGADQRDINAQDCVAYLKG